MPHLAPGGCGPMSRGVTWGGASGRLEASPDPAPEGRLLLAGEADLRVGVQDSAPGRRAHGLLLFRASPTIGFDSEYVMMMAGAYVTNEQEREAFFGSPSVMVRLGTRDAFWVTLDLFDEPACFLAQCILGASYGVVVSDVAVLNQGFSIGLDGVRTWLRVPFVEGETWWVVGAEIGQYGVDTGGGSSFSLTLGLRTPWAM